MRLATPGLHYITDCTPLFYLIALYVVPKEVCWLGGGGSMCRKPFSQKVKVWLYVFCLDFAEVCRVGDGSHAH